MTTIGILIALLEETIGFFGDVDIVEFFTTSVWTPLFADAQFGVWPLVWGTLMTTGIALIQSGQALAYLGSSVLFGLAWQFWSPETATRIAAVAVVLALVTTAALLGRRRS